MFRICYRLVVDLLRIAGCVILPRDVIIRDFHNSREGEYLGCPPRVKKLMIWGGTIGHPFEIQYSRTLEIGERRCRTPLVLASGKVVWLCLAKPSSLLD
jgi:hypothetical protein